MLPRDVSKLCWKIIIITLINSIPYIAGRPEMDPISGYKYCRDYQ